MEEVIGLCLCMSTAVNPDGAHGLRCSLSRPDVAAPRWCDDGLWSCDGVSVGRRKDFVCGLLKVIATLSGPRVSLCV